MVHKGMEDVAKSSRIQWLGGRAYYRRRIPSDLVAVTGKKQIRKALGTTDKAKAKALAAVEDAKHEIAFFKLREQRAQANDNPDQLSNFSTQQLAGLAMRWLSETETKHFINGAKATADITGEEWKTMFHSLQFDLSQIQEAIKFKDIVPGLTTGSRWLKNQNISFDPKSEKFRQFGSLMNYSILTLTKNALDEAKGLKVAVTGFYQEQPQAQTAGSGPSKTINFDDLFQLYLDDPSRDRNPRSKVNYLFSLKVLKEVIGADKLAHTLIREDCMAVLKLLKELPTNYTKRFPGLTVEEAIAAGKIRKASTLSAKSINKYMTQLASVMNFALLFGYVTKNVAEDIRIEDPVSEKDKKDSFSIEDLRKMFSAPLYVGCVDDKNGYNKPGPNVVKRARFWIPLLALFTSMRLNEICQLTVEDITEDEGVPDIVLKKFNAAGEKQLKTTSTARVIPIHDELKRIGFLSFVKEIKEAGGSSLFPELAAAKGARYMSDQIGPKLNRFIASCNLKKTGIPKSFHSFRHTFATALRDAPIGETAKNALGGWKDVGTRTKVYTAKYSAPELYEFVCHVQYKGLNLSHLYV